MFTLTADNRPLTKNAKYSYLSDNYLSGVSSLVVINSDGYAASDYILLGEFGEEQSEIVQISTVTSATHTLALTSTTVFAHAQDTKVTIIKYNQVRFYRTTTATFSSNPANELTGSPTNVQADSRYTILYDTTNTTGFGWFVFYNSTTAEASSSSNAIPYAGFDENSVRNVLDNFFSLLNNKEMNLISSADAYRWLNEAYSVAVNELNLVNRTYNIAASYSITTVSGTQEYALPTAFSRMLSVWDDEDDVIMKEIAISEVEDYSDATNNLTKYYVTSSAGTAYIGFAPTPDDARIIKVRYRSKSTRLTSPYDNINLPDNNFYCLIDFMLYRAAPKLNRPNGSEHYKMFLEGINRMKVTSHKQGGGNDQWGIEDTASI